MSSDLRLGPHVSNDYRFSGRVALVTGGASGIGAAVAKRFVSEGAARRLVRPPARLGRGVLALAGDVSKSADIEAAVQRVEQELGPIDVLVCSAGVPGESLPSMEISDEEWRRVLAINADGVFFCNRIVGAGNGRARLRPHRQRRLDRRQGGQPDGRRVLRVQGRGDRADEGDRQGSRAHRACSSTASRPR